MRFLLTMVLAGTLCLVGCDANTDDSFASPQLTNLTLTDLPDAAQAVVDQGGTIVWEVQDVIGRSYATEQDLPTTIPGNADLVVVVADASTCTPKCDLIAVTPFRAPSDPNIESIDTDGSIGALLDFVW